MPIKSAVTHLFREVCLSMLAAFPELAFRRKQEDIITVAHPLNDKHHIFEVTTGKNGYGLKHTWGSSETNVKFKPETSTIRAAVARVLDAGVHEVEVPPHPALTRMLPLWADNRRWKQSRKGYKNLINQARYKTAKAACKRIQHRWTQQHADIAKVLRGLS